MTGLLDVLAKHQWWAMIGGCDPDTCGWVSSAAEDEGLRYEDEQAEHQAHVASALTGWLATLAADDQTLARVTAAIYGDGLDDAPAIAHKAITAFLDAIQEALPCISNTACLCQSAFVEREPA